MNLIKYSPPPRVGAIDNPTPVLGRSWETNDIKYLLLPNQGLSIITIGRDWLAQ